MLPGASAASMRLFGSAPWASRRAIISVSRVLAAFSMRVRGSGLYALFRDGEDDDDRARSSLISELSAVLRSRSIRATSASLASTAAL
ncbi:hypothetical protein Micbo1qcDRAFT_169132, partial [Microdochium bolleyi]